MQVTHVYRNSLHYFGSATNSMKKPHSFEESTKTEHKIYSLGHIWLRRTIVALIEWLEKRKPLLNRFYVRLNRTFNIYIMLSAPNSK